MKCKFIILGGGVAGLTFASLLKQNRNDNFVLIEKENEAGGLCRSTMIDNFPLDIGGGHFLDTRRDDVVEFLFKFMPKEEWNKFDRISKIKINDYIIDHPFEANIWQLPDEIGKEYLDSIKKAGCNTQEKKPKMFLEWIRWKLGDKIADDYMIPYNQKMFGKNLNNLGTYWLEKLPDVSYEDTLNSIKMKKAIAKQPGHATFYYPKKFGYGEVWKRIADSFKDNVIYNTSVEIIDFDNCKVKLSNGDFIFADIIINTIPWTSIRSFEGLPYEILNDISSLRHTSVNITYFDETINDNAHWIYYPDKNLPYHRILLRNNFCNNSNGFWTETNSDRFINSDKITYKNDYAYPLNTIDKPNAINNILKFASHRNIYGLGRWGEWEHYNSDTTVEKAIILYKKLLGED